MPVGAMNMGSLFNETVGSPEQAQKLVEYFERIARDFPAEVWDKGVSTAREWLRLTRADSISLAEMSSLLGVVHGNRFRSSGWMDLAANIYTWIRNKGGSVPPREVFFAPEGVFFSTRRGKVSSLEYANLLLKTFQQYHEEDPPYAAWTTGINAIRDWLRLIAAREPDKDSVSALCQRIIDGNRSFPSQVWADAAIGVWTWCIALGYTELVPDHLRGALTNNGDEPKPEA